MNGTAFFLVRTGLIARVTVLEAVRQRIVWVLLLVAGGLAAGSRALQEFNFGLSELKFIADLGFGGMVFFGSLLTIAATSQLFFSEIENRTALTLLAKPVGRAEFLLGKYMGVMAIVTLFCIAITALIAALLWSREAALSQGQPELFERAHGVRYADVFAVGFAHWLRFALLAAITLLVATYGQSSLYTVMMSLGVLIACHLQSFAREAYDKAEASVPRALLGFIARLFPDFQVFDLGDLLDTGGIESGLLARVTVYAFVNVTVVGALAVFSFGRREI
jgi:hypothetical protein